MNKVLFAFAVLSLSSVSEAGHLSCVSNNGVEYISNRRMAGVAPRPGDILHITEVKKNNEVLHRKVTRLECNEWDFCHEQQPELEDINPENLPISFLEKTKKIIAKEGSEMGPMYKETYVIQAEMDSKFWMICERFMALYP